METTELRAALLQVLAEILSTDPRGLGVVVDGRLDLIFGDEPYPVLYFYGDESCKLHRVGPDGEFEVTMTFGPQQIVRTLVVPASAIAAWSYEGARVTLPGNPPPAPSSEAEKWERAAKTGLRIVPRS